ncbi:MAG: FHA domain-containing protein [Cyanobacteria bacterium Co-bin8]|nr:FHA domain-containing protein [Cyanobacteria bacterium Co-bin8]
MIVCPNCSHQNPDSAVQCEACYTPLPVLATCPSCGASIQADASFCGQCGFDLRTATAQETATPTQPARSEVNSLEVPELTPPDPLVQPEPLPFAAAQPDPQPDNLALDPFPVLDPQPDLQPAPPAPAPAPTVAPSAPAPGGAYSTTQLQVIQARLLHIQTNALLELPANVTVVRIGKPNDRVPPDIDVSGFPDSEIVSRSHAAIRVEGDVYYIEDVGSSNGTYVNNMPLPVGNRHRLRTGDRIALGKGDKVSFLFQVG